MKNYLIIFSAIVACIFNSCKNKDQFILHGKVSHAEGLQKIYLSTADSMGQMVVLDSTFLNEDQAFDFKRKSVNPDFYQLIIGQRTYTFIAENGNEIDFQADLADLDTNYQLTGSEEAAKISEYNKITSDFGTQTGQLATKYTKILTENPDKKEEIIAEFNIKSEQLAAPFLEKSYQFILQNKKSLSAFFAANMMLGMQSTDYESKLYQYSKSAKALFPNNKTVAAFVIQMEAISKTAIGKKAPDFIALTPEGKVLKLSDFKGKFILLDFWASWCGPCRQENPNVVKIYHQYKNKNFTVLGFSLDDEKEKWISAISEDHLDWDQVSELKQWTSPTVRLYNINAIPSSFIINPDGIIVAKNLKGDALSSFLENNLKSL